MVAAWAPLWALWWLSPCVITAAYVAPAEVTLKRILDNYGDPTIRPGIWRGRGADGKYPTDYTEVQVGVDAFANIHQIKQVWEVSGYFRTWWWDPRLAFNATEAGVDRLLLNPRTQMQLIWNPFLYLEDSLAWHGNPVDDAKGLASSINVYPDGSVWRSSQRRAELRYRVDLRHMPFDTQVYAPAA